MAPIRAYKRGHEVVWDENPQNQCWRYADTGAQFLEDRPCPYCDRMPHADGRDGCFAAPIPGAIGACCGHGVHPGYVAHSTAENPPGWWRAAYLIEGGD